MSQYEVAILYDPDLEVDLSKAEDRVKKVFTDNGGEVKSIDNWGKRKLAYPIKHNEHAIYVFYTVELPAEALSKVDASLNITDEVIRFLITRPDLKAIAKAEAEKAEKAEQAKKRGERTDSDQEEAEEDEKE
ncbi:MAG TPA: 30S ribosomal protein S6 [Candidatus Saccharimonadales bacterium]